MCSELDTKVMKTRFRYLLVVLSAVTFSLLTPVLLGRLYFNLGNVALVVAYQTEDLMGLDTAEKFYAKVAGGEYSSANLPFFQGEGEFLRGNFEAAVGHWRDFPDADFWLTMLSAYDLICRNPQLALDRLEIATNLNPKSSTIHYYSGLALYRLEKYKLALKRFDDAIELNKFNDDLSRIAFPQGMTWFPARPDNLTRDPSLEMAVIYKAAAYYQLREWKLMSETAKEAIETNPDNPLGYFQLGYAYLRWANSPSASPDERVHYYNMARHAFEQIRGQVDKYQYSYFYALSLVCTAQNDVLCANMAYQRLVAASFNVDHWYLAARYYADTEQFDLALPLYEQVLSRTLSEPEFAMRWIEAADVNFVVGNADRACDLFQIGFDLCQESEIDCNNLYDSKLFEVCK